MIVVWKNRNLDIKKVPLDQNKYLKKDLVFHILTFLSVTNCATTFRVCKAFNVQSQNKALWLKQIGNEQLTEILNGNESTELLKKLLANYSIFRKPTLAFNISMKGQVTTSSGPSIFLCHFEDNKFLNFLAQGQLNLWDATKNSHSCTTVFEFMKNGGESYGYVESVVMHNKKIFMKRSNRHFQVWDLNALSTWNSKTPLASYSWKEESSLQCFQISNDKAFFGFDTHITSWNWTSNETETLRTLSDKPTSIFAKNGEIERISFATSGFVKLSDDCSVLVDNNHRIKIGNHNKPETLVTYPHKTTGCLTRIGKIALFVVKDFDAEGILLYDSSNQAFNQGNFKFECDGAYNASFDLKNQIFALFIQQAIPGSNSFIDNFFCIKWGQQIGHHAFRPIRNS